MNGRTENEALIDSIYMTGKALVAAISRDREKMLRSTSWLVPSEHTTMLAESLDQLLDRAREEKLVAGPDNLTAWRVAKVKPPSHIVELVADSFPGADQLVGLEATFHEERKDGETHYTLAVNTPHDNLTIKVRSIFVEAGVPEARRILSVPLVIDSVARAPGKDFFYVKEIT